MNIPPTDILKDGPGIDLSDLPSGISVTMADEDRGRDFRYRRNAVTLTADLSDYERVRLAFRAREYGDEPHAPPPAPFGDDANFDGVAISADGENWYEIQDLRNLTGTFTAFDIDLDAAAAACGLAYNDAFRVRFCQFDNGPVAWDGIALSHIRLTGEYAGLLLHLPMDDDAEDAVVRDATGGHDQTFIDPGGDPNTSAHTAAGAVGRSLGYDGIDDRTTLTGPSYRPALAADQDFAICFWWRTNQPDPGQTLHFLSNFAAAASSVLCYTPPGNLSIAVQFVTGETRWVAATWPGGADDRWHHYAIVRQGTIISIYRDGQLAASDDTPENTLALAPADRDLTIGSSPTGNQAGPGWADDLRVYTRSLTAEQVQAVYQLGNS